MVPGGESTLSHPLESLRTADIRRAQEILSDEGLVSATTRFAYLGIVEPPKSEVLSWRPGNQADRRLRAMLVQIEDGTAADVVLSVTDAKVLSVTEIDGSSGRAPILETEYEQVDAIVSGDPGWQAALAKRGLSPDDVRAVALSAGDFDLSREEGRRRVRIVPFMRNEHGGDRWAHPVGGLCGYFDLDSGELYELIDDRVYPVPAESGDYDSPEVTGPSLQGLEPIVITQPNGTSFSIDGEELSWANWSLRVGYDQREGLILRQITFNDGGNVRPVIYRASIAEMVVNYGDPDPTRFWVNYFDIGEYVFGRYGNSLELGCDCVGEIRYLDAELADEFGNPRTIHNAICVHEEDAGVLWKHTDRKADSRSMRRNRRLVISFFTTVGNYDYGFYWYLYLDGTIQCEVKLTGILFQTPYPQEGSPYQSRVAPGLGAPYHQHLFCARLDMTVDGLANAVDEVDAERVPISETNPWGNAFTLRRTRIRSESEGAREANGGAGRTWHIVNTEKTNRVGEPVAYVLYPEHTPALLSDPASAVYRRARFATKQLWVTRYSPDERYPAGEYVNQNPGDDGLPRYVAADRGVDGEDIVVWHTFGPTHIPRVEDWPVMPVDQARFTLKPYGFFDKNPALGLPEPEEHCSAHGEEAHNHA